MVMTIMTTIITTMYHQVQPDHVNTHQVQPEAKVVKKVCWIGGGRSALTCKQVGEGLDYDHQDHYHDYYQHDHDHDYDHQDHYHDGDDDDHITCAQVRRKLVGEEGARAVKQQQGRRRIQLKQAGTS